MFRLAFESLDSRSHEGIRAGALPGDDVGCDRDEVRARLFDVAR